MLIVTKSASHGHGARAIVDGGTYENKAMQAYTAPTIMELRN